MNKMMCYCYRWTQLKGSNPQTVQAGDICYESPTDIHLASRNASTTQSAKLLVFIVKNIGAPPSVAAGQAAVTRR
jgi:quercetin dioxygenase-like cupin family protein